MKKAVFWDVAPYRYCVNRRFEGMYSFHLQGRRKKKKVRKRRTSVSRCKWTKSEILYIDHVDFVGENINAIKKSYEHY
jgi:hypothetical protein